MAVILAAASGNWSATGTWTGGVIPTTGDTAVANGKTVEIDQDITVALLSNATTGGATAGGGFVVGTSLTSGTRNISVTSGLGNVAGAYIGASGALLTISATAGTVALGSTNIKGGGSTNYRALDISGTGVTVIQSGTVVAGSVSGTAAVRIAAAATVTLGNITGAFTDAVPVSAAATLRTGTITGGSGGFGVSIAAANASTSLTATGVVTAGGVAAISVTNAGLGCAIDLQGGAVASDTAAALDTFNVECLVRVAGPITWGANNRAPLRTPRWFLAHKPGTVTTMTIKDDSATPNTGQNVIFSTANGGTRPNAASVRSGTAYDNTTGTCAIPAASSVGYGVPVDATTGTAVLTPAGAWAYEVDTGVTAAARLLAGATVASTQAQLAAGATGE